MTAAEGATDNHHRSKSMKIEIQASGKTFKHCVLILTKITMVMFHSRHDKSLKSWSAKHPNAQASAVVVQEEGE